MKDKVKDKVLATILNRDFQHPPDGWYMIEPKGEHPNRRAGITLVIDEQAIRQIVNRFNEDAAAGKLRHAHELLVDHEHFKDEADKETRAYGWLTKLEAREDGIYGQIRWTATGKTAVDGGDYRFFSTEYDPADCEAAGNGSDGKDEKYVRPTRLDGLTLTNMHNNRGQRPITNRGGTTGPLTTDHKTLTGPAAARQAMRDAGAGGTPALHSTLDTRHSRSGQAGTLQNKQQSNKDTKMNTIATKLGLAAEASEDALLAELTKIINRADEATQRLTTAQGRIALLETENATLLGEQIEADFAAAGIKDDKIVNRHKPLLTDPKHFKNRAERVEFIKDLSDRGQRTEDRGQNSQRLLRNRDTKAPEISLDEGAEKVQRAEAVKIQNRACELQKQMPHLTVATAYTMAQREMANN
ncbi:MAG: hypothetical protein C5B50_07825 [Verrucomicrobia bacterium]|nr:MAG: hypothetical protein C5B50_07825 [Verrucomicrobiota bacterium]